VASSGGAGFFMAQSSGIGLKHCPSFCVPLRRMKVVVLDLFGGQPERAGETHCATSSCVSYISWLTTARKTSEFPSPPPRTGPLRPWCCRNRNWRSRHQSVAKSFSSAARAWVRTFGDIQSEDCSKPVKSFLASDFFTSLFAAVQSTTPIEP